VLIHLVPLTPSKYTLKQTVFKSLSHHLGDFISLRIKQKFQELGITNDLIYNPAFQFLTGGPKWLDSRDPKLAAIRKYIGVKGLGDFTLNIRHPREILDNDEIVHSHSHPNLWLSEPAYTDYTKFTSIRNPAGTLNSSIFSINALTSEYIQRFIPEEKDNDNLRQDLALYKFTDLDFFEGLVQHLKSYLTEFIECQDQYHTMRWEDLLNKPVDTILTIANASNISITPEFAANVWQNLSHLNLSGTHKHNFRQGKGIVDDWKNSLTNHHLQIMRDYGFDELFDALGYDVLSDLDEKQYTPFQEKINKLINHNEVYNNYPDQDLFTFAFNKSNLISDKYDFKRYDWKQSTQIERSCFKDEAMSLAIWDIAEASANQVNEVLSDCLSQQFLTVEQAEKNIDTLYQKYKANFSDDIELYNKSFKETKKTLIL